MFFDRFDIVEAYFLFFSYYHEGQGSAKYARLSRMGRYFRAAPSLTIERLSENGREIYDLLAEKEAKNCS